VRQYFTCIIGLYGIKFETSFFRFVTMHAFDRPTDGQADRILIAGPRLHSMQRSENTRVAQHAAPAANYHHHATSQVQL